MEEMIDQVVAQAFCPDASRSGYFPGARALPDDSKDTESTSSSGDSQDEEADNEKAVERFAGEWGDVGMPEQAAYFRHKTSRCLHIAADESGMLFKCGRMATGQYLKCVGTPQFIHPSCAACFRRSA